MRILSFDTSLGELHISLLENRDVVFERQASSSSNERQEVAALIMPEIDRAYSQAGWSKSSADAIVVGVGPGSFTAIRVAVITARTLAQIFKLPLIPINLLETYYFAVSGGAQVAALPDAPTEDTKTAAIVLGSTAPQVFYAAYTPATTNPVAVQVEPSVEAVSAALNVLGAFVPVFADEKASALLTERAHEKLPKLKNVGTIQAQLAYDRLSLNGFATETFAWQNVLPLYLRSPSVTIKKNYAPQSTANDPR